MMNPFGKKLNRRGQSLVETALILPILLLILLGVLEFGRILSAWMTVTHASREGARVAALGGSKLQVEERVDSVSGALNLAGISVTVSPTGTLERGDMVTVNVVYQIQLITPFVGSIVGNPVSMSADTVMRVE